MKNLLLLHGALGHGGQFDALRLKLKNQYNLFAPHLAGHGGSELPQQVSIHNYALEVANYIENAVGEPVMIFGHSMGGYIALYMAANKLAPIEKIMTLGTKLNWNPDIAGNEARMLDAERMKLKAPAFVQELEKIHGLQWEDLCRKTADMLIEMGNVSPLSNDDFENIDIPVQLAMGDRDMMVSLEETINVYRKLKNARFLVMPNVPHPYQQVDTDRLAYKLTAFFE